MGCWRGEEKEEEEKKKSFCLPVDPDSRRRVSLLT